MCRSRWWPSVALYSTVYLVCMSFSMIFIRSINNCVTTSNGKTVAVFRLFYYDPKEEEEEKYFAIEASNQSIEVSASNSMQFKWMRIMVDVNLMQTIGWFYLLQFHLFLCEIWNQLIAQTMAKGTLIFLTAIISVDSSIQRLPLVEMLDSFWFKLIFRRRLTKHLCAVFLSIAPAMVSPLTNYRWYQMRGRRRRRKNRISIRLYFSPSLAKEIRHWHLRLYIEYTYSICFI